jgi:two-component system chemotaxis sensor kinase CheA
MSVQIHLDALVWAAAAASSVPAGEASEIRAHAEALAASDDRAVPTQLRARLSELVARAEQVAAGDMGAAATLRALLRELVLEEEPATTAEATAEDEADADLLALFIAAGTDALVEIETSVLKLENSEDAEECTEAVSSLQRDIHTLKGECGVLSLHVAQSIWHEAETMIDAALSSDAPIPIDPLMAALDWHRDHLALLGEDGKSEPPAHGEVLEAIKSWDSKGAPADPAAAAAAPEASDANEEALDDTPIVFTDELLMDETVPEFVTEARQHLEDSEAALFELEADPKSPDSIDRIFRAFHTIKGVAGFLGITEITDLAHVVETLLDRFRTSDIEFTSGHADIVLESKDVLEQLFTGLMGGACPVKAAHAQLVAEVGEVAKDPTDLSAYSSASRRAPSPKADQEDAPEPVEAAASPVQEAQAPPAEAPQSAPEATAEVVPAQAPQAKAAPAPKESGPKKKAKYDSTIRVSTQRLDSLVDMVGELVIAQQMVVQGTEGIEEGIGENLTRNLSHLGKITRDLQEASMSLRMVTFQSTFQKMHRLVRDVAGKAGKSIKLEIQGADTEVDRNVVDKISDPLVHLVRNAIDHGVEPPEDRQAVGKDPQGTVVLSARHQGGAIVISLKDNGRGLNRDSILAKAKEKGLISMDRDVSEMSDSAVYKLIFEPGFSTAAAITDISGRGVGMDVVKRNIEAMRGKVEIFSEFGKGAEFQIQLPLTLAIIDAMIVSCNSERYVIPTLSIVQSFRPNSQQLHAIKGESPVVEVRGQLVPLHRLDQILEGYGGHNGDPAESTLILVEGMGRRVCLVVDDILGQQQVVIKKLGPCTPPARVISGGAILGDGRVALIVDIEGILAETESVALC